MSGDKSSGRGYYYRNCAAVYIRSFALTANKQGAGGQVSLTSKMWQKFTRPFESNSLNLNLKLALLKVVKYISQSLAEKFWAG